mgnify:CR=1 FL=1
MNWVLSESTTGSLSYTDLSRIMSELIHANTYIINAQGRVLGVGYTNAEDDTSTYIDELGFEKIPEANNRNLLKLTETKVNLLGEKLKEILGEDYPQSGKYHMFIPSVCGGKRIGTILLAKYGAAFTDEDVALGEYGATVVGLEIQRKDQQAMIHERNLRMAVDMAVCSLSYSEHDADGGRRGRDYRQQDRCQIQADQFRYRQRAQKNGERGHFRNEIAGDEGNLH